MTTLSENLNDINNKELLKTLGRVAIPIAAQSLISSSLNLIDNMMVGNLGELELNAVGASAQIFLIYWMIVYGFSSGASTFVTQFFGVGDISSIRKTTGFAITVSLCIGSLFFIASYFFPQYILRIFTKFPEVIEAGTGYVKVCSLTFFIVAITQPLVISLRATQQTKLPLYASVTALITNTVLNYIFIFGKLGLPAMGVTGAALATTIARFLEMSFIFYVIFGRKNLIAGRISEFFDYDILLAKKVIKNALPTTINETMWGVGTSMYLAAYNRIGITEGAAVQACNTINNIFFLVAFSIGDAILIILGQKLGQGKFDIAYAMSKKLLKVGLFVSIILGLTIIICREPVLNLFDFSEEGKLYASKILVIYGMLLWVSVYVGMQISGVLRSGGDTRFPMAAEVLAVWGIGVPLAFITSLYLQWPVYFVVLAVKSEEVVKAALVTWRYFSKKWIKNVTV